MGVGSSGVIDFPGVVDYLSVSAIPAGFVGTAKVGGDLYVGNGTGIASNVSNNIKNKFFASLPTGNEFRKNQFVLDIPQWVSGITISSGYVCQNSGNTYIVQNTAATVSTVAPTGTVGTVITGADAIKWLYLGTANSRTWDTTNTPVCSFSTTPASCTKRYDPQNASDVNAMYFSGSDFQNVSGSGGGFNGLAAINYPNTASVEFFTDSPIIQMDKIQNSGGVLFNILINDVPLAAKCGIHSEMPPTVSNSNKGFIFDWSAQPNKVRKIKFIMINQVFTGVWLPPQYSVWKPYNPNRYRLYIEGDSITQGANPSSGTMSLSHRLAAMLGCDDVWSSATGGTGFINSGGGSTLIQRVQKVITAAPDILYIHTINNDVGNDATFNTTTRKAAYKLYFDTLLTALPNLIIITGGGYGTGAANLLTTAASPYQVELDMAAAVSEYNNNHVIFIPTISAPEGRWMYGDGSVQTSSNSTHGNTDLMIGDSTDTLHPNIRYLEFIQHRLYSSIVKIMTTLN